MKLLQNNKPAVVVALSTLLILVVGWGTSAAPSPNLDILYTSKVYGGPSVMQNLNTSKGETFSDLVNLSTQPEELFGENREAAWSPNGKWALYYTNKKAFLYNNGLTSSTEITASLIDQNQDQTINSIFWSKDSNRLVVSRLVLSGELEYTHQLLYVDVNAQGSLSAAQVLDSQPSSSGSLSAAGILNDNDTFIYSKPSGIYNVKISNGVVTQIVSGSGLSASVSNDGSRYAYINSGGLLFVKNSDGTDFSSDYASGYAASIPSSGMFSKDNSKLIVSNYDISEFNLQTKDVQTIVDAGPSDWYSAAAYSCSGEELFIQGTQNFGNRDIFSVSLNNNSLLNLTNTDNTSEEIGRYSLEPYNQDCSPVYSAASSDPDPNPADNSQPPKVPRTGVASGFYIVVFSFILLAAALIKERSAAQSIK